MFLDHFSSYLLRRSFLGLSWEKVFYKYVDDEVDGDLIYNWKTE